MIRHAAGGLPLAVFALPVAMIEAALLAALVAAIGGAELPLPPGSAASVAAVGMAAITAGADEE